MTARPIPQPSASGAYQRLLGERIVLGRLYMDYLCHSRLAAPQAIMLFRRVLHLDAVLASDERYDQDHLEIVSVREDARYHRPPRTVPEDHDVQPCGLCRKLALDLDQDLVVVPRGCGMSAARCAVAVGGGLSHPHGSGQGETSADGQRADRRNRASVWAAGAGPTRSGSRCALQASVSLP